MDALELALPTVYAPGQLGRDLALYKRAFDNESLSDPRTWNHRRWYVRGPAEIMVRLHSRDVGGTFRSRIQGQEREHTVRIGNTQFHSVYFDRFRPHYEPEVVAAMAILLGTGRARPGDFLDIGANWGHFVGIALSFPAFKGRVFAFEPEPDSYQDLTRFVRSLGDPLAERVVCQRQAVTCRTDAKLRIGVQRGFHTGLACLSQAGRGTECDLVALDHTPAVPIALAKLDIEGHEDQAIEGMRCTLQAQKPYVIFESHWDETSNHAYRHLSELGYGFVLIRYRRIGLIQWDDEPHWSTGLFRFELIWHGADEYDLPRNAVGGRKANILAVHPDRKDEFIACLEAAPGLFPVPQR